MKENNLAGHRETKVSSAPGFLQQIHRMAIAAAVMGQGMALANDMDNLSAGAVCLPNDSILRTAEPITELTLFSASYSSMPGNGLVKLRDFLFPSRPTESRIFRLTTWNENEPWETVDYNKVKRGILGDFPEIRQKTATKSDFQGFNRGLSVILDLDELKNKPELQQDHTKWLIDILNRATILEGMALYQVSAIIAGTTWDSAANPDLDLRSRILTLANTTGFYPRNVAYGDSADLKRSNSYESQLTAGSIARAPVNTEAGLATALGVDSVLINAERYQNTATAKQEIIGQNVLLFTGIQSPGPMDPSNIVRHVFNGANGGGEYAVYMTPLGVKKIILTVENYEFLHAQHTTGIEYLAIN